MPGHKVGNRFPCHRFFQPHLPLLAATILLIAGCGSEEPWSSEPSSPTAAPTQDLDHDGYDSSEDCDDNDPQANPDQIEVCDEKDNNCDGLIDSNMDGSTVINARNWYADLDEDTYGDYGNFVVTCAPPEGYVDNFQDCDDTSAITYPGAEEVCGDGEDNNCDDVVDETLLTCYRDQDLDGYGTPEDSLLACNVPEGYVVAGGDCNDQDPAYNPTAYEPCADGLDYNCDGRAVDCGIASWVSVAEADATFVDIQVAGAISALRFGDTNGDGVDDLLVGAYSVEAEEVSDDYDSGAAFLILGSRFGEYSLLSAEGQVYGEWEGEHVGYDVALADLTGDFLPDVIVSALSQTVGERVYVFESPVSGTVDPSLAVATLDGLNTVEKFGIAICPGDLNGDGWPDLAVGASTNSTEIYQGGAVYVFYGPLSGKTFSWEADAVILGTEQEATLGYALDCRGDLNGDGIDDLVIAAPQDDSSPSECISGRVSIFYGPIEGEIMDYERDADLYSYDCYGWGGGDLSTGEDVNGDGKDDLLIGELGMVIYCTSSEPDLDCHGRAYLFHGPIYGQHDMAEAVVRLEGEWEGDHVGVSVLLSDLDGDGQADVVVGANNWENPDDTTGRVFVDYALQEGVTLVSGLEAQIFAIEDQQGVGGALAGGDFNGDGIADLAIAAQGSHNQAGPGHVYVFFGGPRTATEEP